MGNRNYNLDLLRFSSAVLVFLGHLIYGAEHQIHPYYQNRATSVLKLGSFFVLVFFFLSGIALRYQTEKYGHGRRWFFARVVRLMPMYWVTLIISLFGALYFGAKIVYPAHGYALTFLGLQSLSPSVSIPPGNPPLWSLSVEIILSISLMLFAHPNVLEKKLIFILTIVFLITLFPGQGILVGCLFFYSGFLFTHIEVRQKFWSKFAFIAFLSSFLVVALFSQEYFSVSNGVSEILFSYLLVASLTLPLLVLRSIPPGIVTKIAERSYSLYAVHFPVIIGVESLWFQNTDYLTVKQFLITLFLVMFSTELAFQLIEKPSIRQSRRILTRKSNRRSNLQ